MLSSEIVVEDKLSELFSSLKVLCCLWLYSSTVRLKTVQYSHVNTHKTRGFLCLLNVGGYFVETVNRIKSQMTFLFSFCFPS